MLVVVAILWWLRWFILAAALVVVNFGTCKYMPNPWYHGPLMPTWNAIPAMVGRVARYELDEVVRAAAAAYPDPGLRSLDAIHLATAHAIFGTQLTAFVAYDGRLLTAAADLGLPTAVPGR